MTELCQLIRSKNRPIQYEELVNIFNMYFNHLDEQDLSVLISCFMENKPLYSVEESISIAQTIRGRVCKLQPREKELTTFYFNSFLRVEEDKIVQQKLDIPNEIDVNKDFKDILGEQFYKKLINYASSGLLFLKMEEKPHKRYTFFQWVENQFDLFLNQDSSNLYVLLLKQVWSFRFDEAMQTIDKIKICYPQDKERASIQVGLRIFSNIISTIIENEQLKEVFIERKQFQIKFESGHNNKKEQKDFNLKINEIKQQLLFGSNYFLSLKESFKNKYYFSVANFLSNRKDNYVKQNDAVVIIKELSIVDRFFYAKMFFRPQDFQMLRTQLFDSYASVSNLDFIILYGTRKESQQILQNYIDQTNQIQKVAIISVFLKIFLQQGKLGLKDTKIAFYNKFIKFYQFLLVNIDTGISKHKFDQKCIKVEVERKKKTMNKTFSFNCIHCKYSQCLLSITKRIATDAKQHQVRMKGNNVFSKDQRNQVMRCLDCMQLLPKCSVCLYQITVYNGYAQESKKNSSNQKQINGGQSLQNSLVWCPACLHGGHFSHLMKWMQLSSKKCPVYSCKCKCSL